MLDCRPFADRDALQLAARTEWRKLDRSDWLEAFEAHPRIGATDVRERWSRQEQAGAVGAPPHVLEALVHGNQEYEERFGFIFLICASGLTAEEMLEALQSRLSHQRAEELDVAAREHEKITAIRLDRIADID